MKYTVTIQQPVQEERRRGLEQQLSERFGLSVEQAARLSSRRTGRLMKPTSRARAELLLDVFQLAGAAVALELGMTPNAVAGALGSAAAASRWRMEVTRRDDGVVVVNDAYNANPESMAAALGALVTMRGQRTWAVLGEMLELGTESPILHADVGRLAGQLGVTAVVAVGPGAEHIAAGATEAGVVTVRRVQTTDEAAELLTRELRAGDVALFKSSRDSGLRWLGEAVAQGTTIERGGSDR